ncbi:HAD family hydrolase [Ahrensia sp. R2A130]|uniref:HAD family hydrolase n=1 Tax=Ahrensia sp. R2A130 TaxID=744979 RepID=UPI0001E0F898|nr:HAD family hydrolase [Ahrensia sp. R2A130]EFL89029.1 HAD family hydrolase [Ahrensia sp. R2A130]
MTIEAVLFDKDGTLIDFDATFEPATSLVLEDLATPNMPLADLAASVGFDLKARRILPGSVLVAGSLYDIVDHIAEVVDVPDREAFFQRIDRLYRNASLKTLTPFPATEQVLIGLAQRGMKLGVATNDTHAGALGHLNALGWAQYFDFIVGCDSGYGAKPEAGMVTAFCDAMAVSASNTVMVGDSAHDCSAGHAAGAITVAIAQPKDTAAWPAKPDRIIASIEELPAVLREMTL